MNQSKYFSQKELACKDSGVLFLLDGFLPRLDDLREEWGKPLIVNSCCRSLEYNQKIGGAPNSYHIYNHPTRKPAGTCAIDLAFANGKEKGDFWALAWRRGWSIGFNKTFLHIDRRVDLGEAQTCFTY